MNELCPLNKPLTIKRFQSQLDENNDSEGDDIEA